MQSFDALIATLNNLEMGELSRIDTALAAVRSELERRELAELVEKIDLSQAALRNGDLEEFKRLCATVVSKLGHLRTRQS